MKRIALLLLSALPCLAVAQVNQWSATCTDTAGRSSVMSVSFESRSVCKTTITGDAPTKRADGSPLALADISYCTLYRARNGNLEAYRIDPKAKLSHVHTEAALCPQDPPVTPPPATFGPPTNFSVTITTGTAGRINCTAAPGTRRIILFAVNADGSLGSRLKVYSACGGTYGKFGPGRRFVLKAEDAKGKQSGRSNVVTI